MVIKIEDWDQRHGVPIVKASTIEASFPIFEEYRYRIRVGKPATFDQLPIDALMVPGNPGSKRLIVAFHGAIDRRNIEIPRFEWFGQLDNRSEHRLFIADTTLELADDLNLSWYLGTPKFNLISHIAAFIEHVRFQNGINEIVLIGSSGGGFAALSIGAALNNSCSIAFSPQTDIWRFSEGHSIKFKESVFPDHDWERFIEEMKSRTDLIPQYNDGRHLNHFLYYQNLGDTDHVLKHWKRFAESQGVRLKNGRSFNQQGVFISEFDGDGHCRPPTGKLSGFLDKAFEMARINIRLIEDSGLTGNLMDYAFHIGSNELEKVPADWLFYASKQKFFLPQEGESISYSQSGVPLRLFSGQPFDHPVLQAQMALKFLNNYDHSEDDKSSVEKFVTATINRLIEYSVSQEGALFFPFGFPWHQDRLQPPWYSAMAQGQVLQLVCRFMEKTGNRNFMNLVL